MAKLAYQSQRRVENQRLAYYSGATGLDFWEQHWRAHLSPGTYARAERGYLDYFEEPFTRYLPKPGHILEAGCGLGQHVLALRARGYDAEGVEWGSETVEAVRSLYPDLPIRVGDVTKLDVPDGTYSGYISLGVVEHRQAGPEPFLREALRVLKPGGVALISVPYFHRLRRLKARLGLYRGQPEGLQFYQYVFTKTEFFELLQIAGFEVIDHITCNGFKGVKDEIPLLRWILTWRGVGWRLGRWLQSWKWMDRYLGHTILFVCRKVR